MIVVCRVTYRVLGSTGTGTVCTLVFNKVVVTVLYVSGQVGVVYVYPLNSDWAAATRVANNKMKNFCKRKKQTNLIK